MITIPEICSRVPSEGIEPYSSKFRICCATSTPGRRLYHCIHIFDSCQIFLGALEYGYDGATQKETHMFLVVRQSGETINHDILDDMHEAIGVIEETMNADQNAEVRLFTIQEMPLTMRASYRVELTSPAG